MEAFLVSLQRALEVDLKPYNNKQDIVRFCVSLLPHSQITEIKNGLGFLQIPVDSSFFSVFQAGMSFSLSMSENCQQNWSTPSVVLPTVLD